MLSEQQLFELKTQLTTDTEQLNQQLHALEQQQREEKSPEKLAATILEFERLQQGISDRGELFAFFSAPDLSVTSPYQKSELFQVVEAAETIGTKIVDIVADYFLDHIRADIQAGEDDAVDLIQAEFKEYIIPAKIIADRFDQLDDLLDEMNRYCRALDPNYDIGQAEKVLVYAFELSLNADVQLDTTIHALREFQLRFLTPEDRALLLDRVEERLAVLRFEKAKNQEIAIEKALEMIEQRKPQ